MGWRNGDIGTLVVQLTRKNVADMQNGIVFVVHWFASFRYEGQCVWVTKSFLETDAPDGTS